MLKNSKKLHANLFSFVYEGVIEYCGMVKVSNSYLMSVGNLGSQIIDQFMAYFGLRLSRAITN